MVSKYIAYPKRTWLLFDMIAILLIDNRKIGRQIEEKTSWNRYMKIAKPLLAICYT